MGIKRRNINSKIIIGQGRCKKDQNEFAVIFPDEVSSSEALYKGSRLGNQFFLRHFYMICLQKKKDPNNYLCPSAP